jgi:hypothetical protein
MFCRRGSDVVGVPCPAAQIGGVARLGLTALACPLAAPVPNQVPAGGAVSGEAKLIHGR